MNAITMVMLAFCLLAAADRIIGNRFGLGREFDRAFGLLGPVSLSMIGMLVIAPVISTWLEPVFTGFYNVFNIDPSVIPASLFANDMGGLTLALKVCKNENIGAMNAYVVSSMMGCTISYTLPFALGVVKKEYHEDLFFGLLCGIVTIPVGCIVAGVMCGVPLILAIFNLLPLILLSAIIAVGVAFFQNVSIKIFRVVGIIMNTIITIGLSCGIFTALTGITIVESFDSLQSAAIVCVNAIVILSGAFPLMEILRRLLAVPIRAAGRRTGLNPVATVSLLTTLVSATPTIGVMDEMDKKGRVLNSAFAVSAAFTFGGHLAFTVAYDAAFLPQMIVGKLISGVTALILAAVLYKRRTKAESK